MGFFTTVGGSGSFIFLAVIERVEEVLTLVGFPFLEDEVLAFLMGVVWTCTIERGTTSVMTSGRSISVPIFFWFDCSLEDLLGVEIEGYDILKDFGGKDTKR